MTEPICVGPPDRAFLFGGVGLAAAVSAMEQTCQRPVIWATAQYLSFARLGSILDLDVWVPAQGNQTSQARVIGHVDDREIITVNAALGARAGDVDDQWVQAPAAPPPDACEPVSHWRGPTDDLDGRFDMRLVRGRFQGPDVVGRGDGRIVLWMRPKGRHPIDTTMLCVMADMVSTAITDAIGRLAGGNSLDNTIRFARHDETEWVLCDISIESIQRGVVHGAMRLFSERGVLLATASQSMILRLHAARGASD